MKLTEKLTKKDNTTLMTCRIDKDLFNLVKSKLKENNSTITSLVNASFQVFLEELNEKQGSRKVKKQNIKSC